MKNIQFAKPSYSIIVLYTLLVLGRFLNAAIVQAAEPTYIQQAKLTASDGAADDRYGSEVAVSGNWAVVGVPQKDVGGNADQGAVYVYARFGQSWVYYQKLTANDGQANDNFGSVAIKGNTLVIGAPGDEQGRGSVYVFTLAGSLWTQQQKLTASDGTIKSRFGSAVAVDGPTLIVGAPREIYDYSQPGTTYVFGLTGNTWTQQQKLAAGSGPTDNDFGRQVAISGETVVVAAHIFDHLVPIGPSSFYIYVRAGGNWSLQQKLTPEPEGTRFELAGLSGDSLAIGSYGRAFIFARTGVTWSEQQQLARPDSNDAFPGTIAFNGSFAFDGDRVVIGVPDTQWLTSNNLGAAYIFKRSGASWIFAQKVIANDGATDDRFGDAVAVSGDTLLTGAHRDDIGANADQGSAYIFTSTSSNTIPVFTPASTITIQQGATLNGVVIGTVSDLEDAAGSLTINPQGYSFGDSPILTNIINNGGIVTATITAECSNQTGARKLGMNVIDSKFSVGMGILEFNVIPNPIPTLGEYPSAFVLPGQSVTVTPNAPPSGSSPVSLTVSIWPLDFAGTVTINQTSGAVTISNALPAGFSGTVYVKAKESCSSIITRSFTFTVLYYYAPPVLTSSANPAPAGQGVIFTATVPTPRGAPAPTGTIQFQINGTNCGLPTPLRNGSASATNSALPAGNHRITAIYSGDANYQSTSSTITQIINR
jgi:hypothetical protein